MNMTHDRLQLCIAKQETYDKFIADHDKEAPHFRDRVLRLEIAVQQLEKDVMKNAIVGGMIGALIGSGAAPAIRQVINLFFKLG